jgi:PKD repeat protein
MELIHSTASSAEWQFGDASYTQTANDTAYVVWDTAGYHTVQATVTNPYGTVEIDHTIPIADCTMPISTFPYEISFSEEDELQRICWSIFSYGDGSVRILEDDDFNAIFGGDVDLWYASPLIDLSEVQNTLLQLRHTTPENFNVTVEISQGGLDSGDFVPIYTLTPSEDGTTTPPINLSEHYQGNPIRLALHMRSPEGRFGRFELNSLRIWCRTEGIDNVAGTTMSVTPNPAKRMVTVTLPDPDGTLTLFDATGRQIMRRRTAATQTSVDVRTLPQGVYLLQYTSPRGTSATRLVVQ